MCLHDGFSVECVNFPMLSFRMQTGTLRQLER